MRPGRTTAEIASVWPKAQEFGFPNEEAAFALQFGHGIGLAIWEKPVISRLVSLEHPHEIKPGMVFALETFWPSKDGWSAARIEEEIVVTETGHEVITRFPAEKLLVAGAAIFHGRWTTARAARARSGTESSRWWKNGGGQRARGTGGIALMVEDLKLKLTGYTKPGQESFCSVLFDKLCAHIPKDPEYRGPYLQRRDRAGRIHAMALP